MRQPILLDPTRHANFLCPPTIVQRPNRPINMAANQRQCWCNQVSGDVRAIREMMSAVNNGVHCAIQKLHTDQIQNQETISNIMNTVEMIADTVTQLLLTHLQACEQYVNDDNAAGSDSGNLHNDGSYCERGDETAQDPNSSYDQFH
uniref:BLOC-1-related complex subunit 7 n=1 Tax=Elaeophora elaphi TaxID=1147741 RepID=A0A0R3RKX6_9BILA